LRILALLGVSTEAGEDQTTARCDPSFQRIEVSKGATASEIAKQIQTAFANGGRYTAKVDVDLVGDARIRFERTP
jgi:hypothetical protein